MVAGMSLARENDLDRAFLVVQDRPQPLQVAENERAALVSGEAPREPDGEGLRVQDLGGAGDFSGRRAAPLELNAQPRSREGDQALAAPFVRPPQLLVRYVVRALPDAVVRRPVFPLNPQVT